MGTKASGKMHEAVAVFTMGQVVQMTQFMQGDFGCPFQCNGRIASGVHAIFSESEYG